jgi:2-polyprenyl-3-methyl-5-hydroxy-6-metoxy-1,4-benzoquinol methylase
MPTQRKPIKHISASASHYDQEAQHYDAFNETQSAKINQTIENILRHHKMKRILDFTCGTGSQVFWLAKKGFETVGVDINAQMLAIAKDKAAKQSSPIHFEQGDIRTSQIGQFDAVLSIFNSIGHLTKEDFKLALKNVYTNLIPGGLYIFDIFNLDYLLHEDNITKLTIDNQKKYGDITAREIQYSTISEDGVLTSFDVYHEQQSNGIEKVTKASQTLQVYNQTHLKALLEKNGFKVIQQSDIDGGKLHKIKTERILTVAKNR